MEDTPNPLDVPYYPQPEGMPYCGAASLKMVLDYYGTEVSIDYLAVFAGTTIFGTTTARLAEVAGALGYDALAFERPTWQDVVGWLREGTPIIALVNSRLLYNEGEFEPGHFVVILSADDNKVEFHDPINGPNTTIPVLQFDNAWVVKGRAGVRIWNIQQSIRFGR